MLVSLPTPTPTVHTHSNSALRRGRIELRATSHQSLRKEPVSIVSQSHQTVSYSPQQSRQVTKVIFGRTAVSHTLGKHSTRPHDTTRSNLTGSRSRRAARSEGAAQKSVLHRDQQLPVATARIDPAITRLRCPARSARSGDVRGGSRPSDRADQAAKARNGMAQLWMSVEGCAKGCGPSRRSNRGQLCLTTASHTHSPHSA